MTTFQVHHLQIEEFDRDARDMAYDIRRDVEIARRAYTCQQPGLSYRFVATVECNNVDQVFEKTNSIDSFWALNKGVTLAPGLGVGCRSTSVGDIIINEQTGEKHLCMPFGWETL